MTYRIAGIDVHKRMLAVVIADAAVEGEYQFQRRKVGTTPSELCRLADWLVPHRREIGDILTPLAALSAEHHLSEFLAKTLYLCWTAAPRKRSASSKKAISFCCFCFASRPPSRDQKAFQCSRSLIGICRSYMLDRAVGFA